MPGTTDYRFFLRNYFLRTVDSLLILAAVVLYLQFFHHKGFDGLATVTEKPQWFGLILILWYLIAWAFDLYDPALVSRRSATIRKTAAVAFITAVVYLFTPFLSPNFPLTRLPAVAFISGMVFITVFWRLIYSSIFRNPILPRRALVVGDGWQVQKLLDTLVVDKRVYHENAYRILGRLSLKGLEAGGATSATAVTRATGASDAYDVPVLDHPERLESYIARLDVEEIILAGVDGKRLDSQNYTLLAKAKESGLQISSAAEVYETVTGKLMVEEDNGLYLLVNSFAERETDRFYRLINRLLNFFWGAAGSFILLLMIPFVWLANLLFSRGPLFYSQERVGRKSRVFQIYKFRTMVVDAEKAGPQMAQQGDARVTPVGRLLRKTRIDELPQFWNLFRGDMNLIGPRPERPEFVYELSERINFYPTRHAIKPGITGWAQVNYKYGSDYLDSLVKLQYDLYYIKHRSFLIDLRIIARTFGVILKFKGT